uniref:Uncharacterized protein n=1 Tax=Anguilla anguilla TaxID=7936 RepID=A0A0E9VGK4_ANGAN
MQMLCQKLQVGTH